MRHFLPVRSVFKTIQHLCLQHGVDYHLMSTLDAWPASAWFQDGIRDRVRYVAYLPSGRRFEVVTDELGQLYPAATWHQGCLALPYGDGALLLLAPLGAGSLHHVYTPEHTTYYATRPASGWSGWSWTTAPAFRSTSFARLVLTKLTAVPARVTAGDTQLRDVAELLTSFLDLNATEALLHHHDLFAENRPETRLNARAAGRALAPLLRQRRYRAPFQAFLAHVLDETQPADALHHLAGALGTTPTEARIVLTELRTGTQETQPAGRTLTRALFAILPFLT
jgi:hypothetical protein